MLPVDGWVNNWCTDVSWVWRILKHSISVLLLNITDAASAYYTKAPKYSTTNVPEYYKLNRRREKVK
jgi:hypothetical protein